MSKASALASLIGSSGGAASSLASIGDVQIVSQANRDGLAWDSAALRWINKAFDATLLPQEANKNTDPKLFNIRKLLRVGPDVLDWGGAPSASLDRSDQFEAAFAGIRAEGLSALYVPSGNYRWHRQVQMNHGVRVVGDHKSHSVIKFYHTGTGLVVTGLVENGGGLNHISIVNDSGATATAYVQLIASSLKAPDFFNIMDCNFSSFSKKSVGYGIICNGAGRDGSAIDPETGDPIELKGIRNLQFAYCDVFSANTLTMDFRVVRGLNMQGMNALKANGAVAKTRFSATASTNPTHGVRAYGCSLGDVSIDLADDIILDGEADVVTISTNASRIRIAGFADSVTGLNTARDIKAFI